MDNILAESKIHARIQSRWDCPVMDNMLAESKTHVIIQSRWDDIFVKGYIYLLSLEKVISNVSLRSRDVFPFFLCSTAAFPNNKHSKKQQGQVFKLSTKHK